MGYRDIPRLTEGDRDLTRAIDTYCASRHSTSCRRLSWPRRWCAAAARRCWPAALVQLRIPAWPRRALAHGSRPQRSRCARARTTQPRQDRGAFGDRAGHGDVGSCPVYCALGCVPHRGTRAATRHVCCVAPRDVCCEEGCVSQRGTRTRWTCAETMCCALGCVPRLGMCCAECCDEGCLPPLRENEECGPRRGTYNHRLRETMGETELNGTLRVTARNYSARP